VFTLLYQQKREFIAYQKGGCLGDADQ